MTNPLTSRRLIIRPLTPADVTPAYVAGLNDPDVTRQTEAYGRAWSMEEVLQYVRTSNTPGVSELHGLFLADSCKHVGNVRLFAFTARHLRCELGIMIFDKQQWGRGLGSEALSAIVEHVFSRKGLQSVCADYHATNRASARIFSKAGFAIEGVFREHFRVDGQYVDSVRVAKLSPRT